MQVRTALTLVVATVVLTSGAGAALGADAGGASGPASVQMADGHAGNATVNVTAAEETVRDALANRSDYNWTLVETKLHEEDGYYEFEFALDSQTATGDAEVRVDASSGDAFRVEEEIEPLDETEKEDGHEDENETEKEDEHEDENETEKEDEHEDEGE